MDFADFCDGKAYDAYKFFGAHKHRPGIIFRTYAPGAKKVFVVGDFNRWQPEEMHRHHSHGVYVLQSKQARVGQMYKYAVLTGKGTMEYHCDPYGYGMQLRPDTASIIVDLSEFRFRDSGWIKARDKCFGRPLNIYEVHLGSWMKNNKNPNGWYSYKEISRKLITYVKKHHYSHIEFLPLCEHPADRSWGYQISGYFSPTSRYGTARDFMELINNCHQAGIGVIMDFVPVHFAIDGFALKKFDGKALYEYSDRAGSVSEWGSCNFNHSRGDVRSFLQSCANFWLGVFHFDGIRVDAVSRLIYRQGNPAKGINKDGLLFLKNMNQGLSRLHPGALLIAEDSSDLPDVTTPVALGGLGFDYKWDLGWMNDTLDFFRLPPVERPAQAQKLMFSMHYFFKERFILPFSHDEVVHCKGTLINKMWGDRSVKWRQLRALYMYFFAHPGKKLSFMGNEIAQLTEWDEAAEINWALLNRTVHSRFHEYFSKLAELYCKMPPLHKEEFDTDSFCWIKTNPDKTSVFAFLRGKAKQQILAVFNFSDKTFMHFSLPLPAPATLRLLLQSNNNMNQQGKPANRPLKSVYNEQNSGYEIKINLPVFTGKLFLCSFE